MKAKRDAQDMELQILSAAEKVFIRKGRLNATMGDIAKEAGISRTSLNYYFRSKNRLFEGILGNVLKSMLPDIKSVVDSDAPMLKKFEGIIDTYTRALLANPSLPRFIISEINLDADNFIRAVKKMLGAENVILRLRAQLLSEMKKGNIRKVPVIDLVTAYIGLMAFPFMAKNLLERVFLENKKGAFEAYILQRRTLILEIISGMLEIEKPKKRKAKK